MMARIDNETVRYLFHVQVQIDGQPPNSGEGTLQPPPPTPSAPRPWRLQRARPHAPQNKRQRNCLPLRVKWNASNSARKRNCSIRRAQRKPKRQSRFAPAQKSGATILAPVAPAKVQKVPRRQRVIDRVIKDFQNVSFRTEQADVFALPIPSEESVGLRREESLFDLR